jgi:translation initiation factor 2B subunit (eIF-2B alpha/beta/delta family)
MGNVIKYIRQSISKISPELSEADAKEILLCNLQTFIEEKIVYAGMSIARFITSIINDGEVILTFGSSPLIRKVLLYASEHKKFRLVVVDTRPLNEGLQTLSSLSGSIHCVYSPISATPVVLKDVTKVILGASCLLSNGSMLAAAGTAMVAALAKQRQIPVIVASESYKFSDKVQLDSIVFNELGNANEIVTVYKNNNNNLDEPISTSFQTNPNDPNTTYFIAPQREAGYKGSADKHTTNTTSNNNNNNDDNNNNNNSTNDNSEFIQNASNKTLSNMKLPFDVINLRYDLTPLNNISVIATETGLIPPTSIPVLIREIQSDTK